MISRNLLKVSAHISTSNTNLKDFKMKKLLAILFITSFISCSVEAEDPEELDVVGDWVLVQTTGSFDWSPQTGSDMPFQETYSLKDDGSFLKVRLRDGEESEATGTYTLPEDGQTINGEEVITFVEFHYEEQNPLIANCTQTLVEELYLTTKGKLISTYEACDGLGLKYEKLNP